MDTPWQVDTTHSPIELAELLSLLYRLGHEIKFILTEGPEDGFNFTVVSFKA